MRPDVDTDVFPFTGERDRSNGAPVRIDVLLSGLLLPTEPVRGVSSTPHLPVLLLPSKDNEKAELLEKMAAAFISQRSVRLLRLLGSGGGEVVPNAT